MNYGCFAHLHDGYTIKKSGYDSIELNLQEINAIEERELAKYAKEYKSLGLTVYSVSWILPTDVDLTSPELDRKRWLEYLKRGAERCAELGVSIWPFGCGYGRSIKPDNKESVASQTARVNSFIFDTAEICSKYNIKLALEPLGPSNSNYIQTLAQANDVIKEIAHPDLFMMCDFRHMCATSDEIARIADYDDSIVHCHIDMPLGKKRLFPRADDGVDYSPYLRAVLSLKCQQLSVEAIDAKLVDAEASLKYIKEKNEEIMRF